MGPKFGYNSKDNGWLILDKHRVPRSHLLQRYMKVDDDGSVSMQGNPKVFYTTMMKTRMVILSAARYIMMGGLLIGIRYSIVRRQFKNISGVKEETKLLDYQTQQMKLFPLLAFAMASSYGSEYVINMLERCI